ncbi:M1 family metallopeptidase [Amycolatopsis acidiphila]|uniref:Aminopeptidase N n=1 Tax=Amycolatopsis acidiphila TaxID=715473 RepID=A0A557ZPC8_9PSEU|nr:M1 family metallopeptidase [Amycolatopsis acidiphila]TVT13871.1 M1 family metallopeptidase [Amycolatopsis acidiphila]UIJ60533.1 M1 family metallopeptidase [Amycolatopsis acidiphila]GHG82304.1 peptidase [Amycolatopsis acidiphila]
MRLRTRAGLGAVATGIATTLLTATASAAPAAGASGVGDPYYPYAGNGGYDVSHYDIRLTYQPATDLLSGTTTILAKATQDLSSFDLDFGLHVNSVLVNNVPATFHADPNENGELVVTPGKALNKNQSLTVVVNYADTPSKVVIDGYTAWKKTPDGALAVDEPQNSQWWFPANDHPTDKATYDVSVEVPDNVSALSNGTLVRTTKQRPGWTRWNWRSTQPQATYLTTLEVGAFEVNQSTTPDGKPFITAYDPAAGESLDAAKASVERTPEIDAFLATQFGPYPFEAQGGVVSTGLNFALEAQTRPVYGAAFFRSGSNTSVIAHENTHQWFGDAVSLGRWSDIWLNEGFASYAEYLWSGHEGEGTPAELAQYVYDSHPANDALWQVLPGDPGAANQFDDAVYDRGALTLQALRTEVGDDAFFTILRTWVAQHKGGDARIQQFIALAEQISGKPLQDLFTTWLFTKGKPAIGPNGASTFRTAQAPTAPKSYAKIQQTHELLAAAHQY